MNNPVLTIATELQTKLDRLIEMSHTNYIDLKSVLPWSTGANRQIYPKRSDACWMYGTDTWNGLSDPQRLEVAWHEIARDCSMFIWLEQAIPPLYVSYVVRHGADLAPSLRDYLMIFSKEEIVHTLMFREYLRLAGLEMFSPPALLMDLFTKKLPGFPPVLGILCTYLAEAVAEIGFVEGTDGPGVDPLTRALALAHHREEARHLAFGRWIAESHIAAGAAPSAREMARIIEPMMSKLIEQYTFNDELASRMPLGFSEHDKEAMDRMRCSENNKTLNASRFGHLLRWLKEWSLVGADYQW
ncbi:MAG: diiron oxygenase [Polyangiaceae bacterium]|jgi:hypothetical protein